MSGVIKPDLYRMEVVHGILQVAFDGLSQMSRAGAPVGISIDTAFACGEVTGLLAKAKALLGRDIDDARRQEAEP